MNAAPVGSPARSLVVVVAVMLLFGFTGCGTVPVTYKTRAETAGAIAALRTVKPAPLDIAVHEISAGGGTEKHDELTRLVGENVTAAITQSHGLSFAPLGADFETGPVRAELDEVQALLRAIRLQYQNPDNLRLAEIRYGSLVGDRLYVLRFTAPARHYFERDRAAFEEAAQTLRLNQP